MKTIKTFFLTLCLAAIASTASAELSGKFMSYDYTFSPRIDLTATNSDNIIKTDYGVQTPTGIKDTFIELAPSARLQFSKEDQKISTEFGINATEHYQIPSEEVLDYHVSAGLEQTFSESFSMKINAGFEDSTLERSALTEEDADQKTDTKTLNGSIAGTYKINRMKFTLSANTAIIDIADAKKNGVTLNKDDEDRTENDFTLSGSYGLSKLFQPSFTLSYGTIDYVQKKDDGGEERSSKILQALIGGRLALSKNLHIMGEGGFFSRDYEGVNFQTVSTYIGNVRLGWGISETLSASASYMRFFDELNIPLSPGLYIDRASLGIEYEATEKLSFDTSATLMLYKMESITGSSKDQILSVGGSYRFSKTYSASLEYTNTHRFVKNTGLVVPYKENVIVLTLSAKF